MNSEKTKFSKFLSVLISVIFIPIILVSLVTSVLMLSSKMRNEVPSFLGLSSVCILTGSMNDGGFKEGQFVMVQRTAVSELKKSSDGEKDGDIIAFYKYYKYTLDESQQTGFVQTSKKSSVDIWTVGAFNDGQKEAAQNKSDVIFHRIVDIVKVPNEDGIIDENDPKCYFFFTQGDSNNYVDQPIRGDMVVGRYAPKFNWLATVFQFCSSIVGILILVLIPCSFLVFLLGRSIIEQVAEIKAENIENNSQYVFAEQIYQDKVSEKIENEVKQELTELQKDKEEEYKKQIQEEVGIDVDKTIKNKQEKHTKQKNKSKNKSKIEKVQTNALKQNQTDHFEKDVATEKFTTPKQPSAQEKTSAPKPDMPNKPEILGTQKAAPKKPTAPKKPSTPQKPSAPKKPTAPKMPTAPKKPSTPKKPN